MTDVYDINTGKKLATIPYGNNNKRKQHHAKLHNKDFEDLKKAQRDYNELMSSILCGPSRMVKLNEKDISNNLAKKGIDRWRGK